LHRLPQLADVRAKAHGPGTGHPDQHLDLAHQRIPLEDRKIVARA